MDTRLLSAKPGLSVSPATLGGGQVSLDRGSLEVKLTEGLEPQEKEINAEFPLPPVNLGKDRATLGSRSGIHPRDLRVDQEQVQDPSSPAEHCGDLHCGDRHLGSPPLGGGTTLATELSGTSAFSGTRGTQGRGRVLQSGATSGMPLMPSGVMLSPGGTWQAKALQVFF